MEIGFSFALLVKVFGQFLINHEKKEVNMKSHIFILSNQLFTKHIFLLLLNDWVCSIGNECYSYIVKALVRLANPFSFTNIFL